MDRLDAMALFVRIVEMGSFSSAARASGMTQPSASRQLRALEKRLGARLLNRSTRHLTLTEAGRAYHEDGRRILAEVNTVEGNLGALQTSLRGTLKVNTSVALGQDYIAPMVYRFQMRHPELTVELRLNERYVDLVEEGIDVAIRFGAVRDDNLVARSLGSTRRVTVAAPRYLRLCGTPKAPADLAGYNCILFSYSPTTEWVYAGPDGEVRVKVSGTFRTNNGHAIRGAVLAGLGIARIPEALIDDQLRSGAVKTLLPGYTMASLDVHAIYASARHLPAKVQAFVDFLQQEFRPDSPRRGPLKRAQPRSNRTSPATSVQRTTPGSS